jgi:hypothetical protein
MSKNPRIRIAIESAESQDPLETGAIVGPNEKYQQKCPITGLIRIYDATKARAYGVLTAIFTHSLKDPREKYIDPKTLILDSIEDLDAQIEIINRFLKEAAIAPLTNAGVNLKLQHVDDKYGDSKKAINAGINTAFNFYKVLIHYLVNLFSDNSNQDLDDKDPNSAAEIYLNSYPEIHKIALQYNIGQVYILNSILRRISPLTYPKFCSVATNSKGKKFIKFDAEKILEYATTPEFVEFYKHKTDIGCPAARASKLVKIKIYGTVAPEDLPHNMIHSHMQTISKLMPLIIERYQPKK